MEETHKSQLRYGERQSIELCFIQPRGSGGSVTTLPPRLLHQPIHRPISCRPPCHVHRNFQDLWGGGRTAGNLCLYDTKTKNERCDDPKESAIYSYMQQNIEGTSILETSVLSGHNNWDTAWLIPHSSSESSRYDRKLGFLLIFQNRDDSLV